MVGTTCTRGGCSLDIVGVNCGCEMLMDGSTFNEGQQWWKALTHKQVGAFGHLEPWLY